MERWEKARLDQQKLGLEIKEQEINDALENVARLESDDQIISSEVRAFLQSNTQELEDSVAAWSIRYNEESERLVRQMNDTKVFLFADQFKEQLAIPGKRNLSRFSLSGKNRISKNPLRKSCGIEV